MTSTSTTSGIAGLIRQCERNCEKQIASEAKSNRKKFRYIKTKKRTGSNIGSITDESGVLTEGNRDPKQILRILFTVNNTESVPESPTSPKGLTLPPCKQAQLTNKAYRGI